MKPLAAAISCLAAIALAQTALSAETPPTTAEPAPTVTWAPATPSIIVPTPNINKDAWEAYKKFNFKPSVDQHLTDPILQGAIDLHAHFGPDSYARQWDAFEIAKLAKARGMRGIVFKNHWSESSGLAYLVRKYADVPGLEVFGGLALDTPEGGINPQAVRYFAEVEGHYARIVWMPTHDAENEVKYTKEIRPYVRVSDNGVLLPEVLEVLDLIKEYNLTLATGHVSTKEMLQIVAEAKKRGIDHIIITHPGLGPQYTDPSIPELKEAVANGAYAEVVATELFGKTKDKMIKMIRALGPKHCFISTDSGLVGSQNHPDALVMSARILRKAGFKESDLDLMFRKNPAWLVRLPPL